jgi:creatinine amidohydrolase/Fe(II)-dependent formamide hydrolase-like protein
VLAGRIAAQLGNALVAPVVATCPKRRRQASGHIRFAGTISVTPKAFRGSKRGAQLSPRRRRSS